MAALRLKREESYRWITVDAAFVAHRAVHRAIYLGCVQTVMLRNMFPLLFNHIRGLGLMGSCAIEFDWSFL